MSIVVHSLMLMSVAHMKPLGAEKRHKQRDDDDPARTVTLAVHEIMRRTETFTD